MRRILVTVVASIAALAFWSTGAQGQTADLLRALPRGGRDVPLILVGDTQRTGFWERVLFREQNDSARQHIMNEIAKERPAGVIFLGDLVEDGSDQEAWSFFDTLTRGLRERSIPVFGVPGNHEYFGTGGEANFLGQIPNAGPRTWSALRVDSLEILLLNSNFSDMGKAAADSQQAWYERTLLQLRQDSAVSSIVVCCHHPPFTNSTIVCPNAEVEQRFVAPFLAAPKARLFFSGHCHSYEHFEKGGKTFLVSGGGGGPRQRVVTDPARRRYADLFQGPPLRPLHFCRLFVEGGRLRVQMVRLDEDAKTFSVGDQIVVGN